MTQDEFNAEFVACATEMSTRNEDVYPQLSWADMFTLLGALSLALAEPKIPAEARAQARLLKKKLLSVITKNNQRIKVLLEKHPL